MKQKIKYFSMFTGVGGFELGIGEHGKCVGFSEIDKYCNAVLRYKFPNVKNYGDATKLNPKELPDFNLLVAGFPCQSFSIAGKRKGFNDTRGTLFFEIARVLQDKRPRYFLLENVKGLLFNEGGKTFQTIIGVLANLGYFIEWQVLNSKNFGVPQNRERVFIIGYLGKIPKRQVFPITISNKKNIKQLNQPTHSNDRVYSEEGISPSLNTMQGGRRQPKILKNGRIRRLTPLECQRLQGFPDDFYDGIEMSDTQKYKQMGNAVTVNVVRYIIEKLCHNIYDQS